jgi:hypothetical protein
VAYNVRADSKLEGGAQVSIGPASSGGTVPLKNFNPIPLVSSLAAGDAITLYEGPPVLPAFTVRIPVATVRAMFRLMGVLAYDDNLWKPHKLPFCVLL